ncbi:MAG: collagen-like protein, partial [bacterium]
VPQSGTAKTSSYTLVIGDNGEYIQLGTSGAVTIPDGVFSAGNIVSVFNNTASNATITCAITTAYIAGTDSDKATMTLATRGVATILFISNSLCVVNGNVS